jgi:hypothetical protein
LYHEGGVLVSIGVRCPDGFGVFIQHEIAIGKLTDVRVEEDGAEMHTHVSKSEGGARRWAQRRARALGVNVEVE